MPVLGVISLQSLCLLGSIPYNEIDVDTDTAALVPDTRNWLEYASDKKTEYFGLFLLSFIIHSFTYYSFFKTDLCKGKECLKVLYNAFINAAWG